MAVRQLKTQGDVRRTLAWLFREIEADKIPVQKGKALVYTLMSLSAVLTEHDLEERLRALEEGRDD
jgi:hypothetical protein